MKFTSVLKAAASLAHAAVASAQVLPTNTIVGNAIAIPELSTLVSIVASPGYEEVLNALNNPNANLTLFAPNNAAFAKLPAVPDYETLLGQSLSCCVFAISPHD